MSLKDKLIWKIIDAFAELSVHAEYISLDFPQGVWKREDVYRWEAYFRLTFLASSGPDVRANVVCWDSATKCCRSGKIRLQMEHTWYWEAHAPERDG